VKRKLKISAESKQALRQFLADADVDLGCRALARREGDRISTIAVAEEVEITRLAGRADARVSIEVLEPIPPAESRRALVPRGNRFLAGELPRGLGEKE